MTASVEFIEPRGQRLTRWAAAAALVVGIHVGGGSYAMLYWPEELVEESPGAIVVEIASVTTALAEEALDRPPGPLIDDSVASQSSSDPKLEKVAEETPKDDLPSPALEPEVTLPKPTKVDEIVKEEVKQEPSPKVEVAKELTPEAKATAPTPIEAEKAAKAAAAAIGTSVSAQRSVVTWQNSVMLHLNRHKRYPAAAQATKLTGSVRVRIAMDRSGQLIESQVVRSSGYGPLDVEALAMLKRASPLPRPPPAMTGELLELFVPIQFTFQ